MLNIVETFKDDNRNMMELIAEYVKVTLSFEKDESYLNVSCINK